MIHRSITEKVLELKDKYPVISITGPRQSGKTSLAQHLFPDYTYHNLENIDVLELATSDPRSFLKIGSGDRMIIDEIQRFPDLLSYIQVEVDKQKIDGQFVITGSQNFAISEGISQSLAGRVANFTLLPLSFSELEKSQYKAILEDNMSMMLKGFYPRPLIKNIKPDDFYRDYLNTYVERDVRQVKNIGDLVTFQKFLQLLAGRVGQLINYSSLGNDVGVNYKTIESWLSILEASYITYSLQPYHNNFGKRLIKNSKVYFYDVGLLCYLLRIDSVEKLQSHFAFGQIYENFIISEVMKINFNKRSNEQLYFWRDNSGNEVDLIRDTGGSNQGIELKASKTFGSDMLKGLEYWRSLEPKKNASTYLVYNGDVEQESGGHVIMNWRTFLEGLK